MAEVLNEFPPPEPPYVHIALDGWDHYLPIEAWPENVATEVREFLEAFDPRGVGA